MAESKPILINKKGMITIPVDLRVKYRMLPGSRVSIIEVNGHLEIIPIVDIAELRKHDAEDFEKSIEESNKQELALEHDE
nr:AbrB/MazE/SpoVT family DNA-binding domain-containing protein [Candidatus Sigynarchaeota archaeon]